MQEAILELAAALRDYTAELRLARQGVESRARIPEWDRHFFLMDNLGWLWTHPTIRVTRQDMVKFARNLNTRCDPPKTPAELAQYVRAVTKRPRGSGARV